MKNHPIYKLKKPISVIKQSLVSSGWYRSISDQYKILMQDIEGLKLRVDSINGNENTPYQENKGIPACYKAEKVFIPEDTIVNGTPRLTELVTYGADAPMNFIIRDDSIYNINIPIPGDGVFMMNAMSVTFTQRRFVPRLGATSPSLILQMPIRTHPRAIRLPAATDDNGRLRFSTTVNESNANDVFDARKFLFLWNLLDNRSGRKLSDDWLSSTFLLEQSLSTPVPQLGVLARECIPFDGDIFRFTVPWMFERDTELEFRVNPLMPFLQLDASSGLLPYGYNDREQGDTVRDGRITARVELHGAKFLTKQDALKYGARFKQ